MKLEAETAVLSLKVIQPGERPDELEGGGVLLEVEGQKGNEWGTSSPPG